MVIGVNSVSLVQSLSAAVSVQIISLYMSQL